MMHGRPGQPGIGAYHVEAYGQRFQGPVPDVEGGEISVLTIENMFPPRLRTVQLDRTIVRGANGNGDWRCVITYGMGGASDTIELDWANGTQVAVVASTIRVVARSFAPDPTNAYTPAGVDAIMAAVGDFASSHARPCFTERHFIPPAGGGFNSVPPSFSKSFRLIAGQPVLNADAYALLLVKQFSNGSAGILDFVSGAVAPGIRSTDNWPLIGGLEVLQVQGLASANGINVAIQYELGL